MTYNFHLMN